MQIIDNDAFYEFIRKYGVLQFEKEIQNSTHYIKYKIDNLKRSFNIQKDEERVKFGI